MESRRKIKDKENGFEMFKLLIELLKVFKAVRRIVRGTAAAMDVKYRGGSPLNPAAKTPCYSSYR